MDRRKFIKKAAAGAGVLIVPQILRGAAFLRESSSRKERPNILLIMSDDHSTAAVGTYKSWLGKFAKTPNIDRIAREGMMFTKCYASNSICCPSRAVIETGVHSHINGVLKNDQKIKSGVERFPKLLQKAGYETAVFGKWHIGTPEGYDRYVANLDQGNYYNPDFIEDGKKTRYEGYHTDIIFDLAIEWLRNGRSKDRPFILRVQPKAPHRPWQPDIKYPERFREVNIPEPESLFDDYKGRGTAAISQAMLIARDLNNEDLKIDLERGSGRMNEEQKKKWLEAYEEQNRKFENAKLSGKELVRWKYQRFIRDYLGCVESIDDGVGRLLKYLDESGLRENTVVIYTSDQGFFLGEHGWFDKRFMYEPSLRMPLIVRWPGRVRRGSVCGELVQNLDFAQTFLDIASAVPAEEMQGASIVPLLDGKKPSGWRKSLYYNYYEYPGWHSVLRHEGVVTKRYKLIHFYDVDENELYDLERDPDEMKNVFGSPKYAKTSDELKKELEQLKKLYKVPEPEKLADKEIEKLKKLKESRSVT